MSQLPGSEISTSVSADPVVMRNLKHAEEDAVFIHCGVGDRAL